MKERGMMFNADMVRAILDGRKTQTRRIMKVQPEPSKTRKGDYWFPSNKLQSMVHVSDFTPGNCVIPDAHEFFSTCCPFGAVGDRIWVRETYGDCGARLVYRADTEDGAASMVKRWTPSIHMPRIDSRILLEITDVRVERLASVSDDDAGKEGYPANPGGFGGKMDKWLWFRQLWDGIYPEQSFKQNPWVWVIEFKRVEGGAA